MLIGMEKIQQHHRPFRINGGSPDRHHGIADARGTDFGIIAFQFHELYPGSNGIFLVRIRFIRSKFHPGFPSLESVLSTCLGCCRIFINVAFTEPVTVELHPVDRSVGFH
ncbi:hypothetical protein D3C76_1598850 [compost metagenome]